MQRNLRTVIKVKFFLTALHSERFGIPRGCITFPKGAVFGFNIVLVLIFFMQYILIAFFPLTQLVPDSSHHPVYPTSDTLSLRK